MFLGTLKNNSCIKNFLKYIYFYSRKLYIEISGVTFKKTAKFLWFLAYYSINIGLRYNKVYMALKISLRWMHLQ